MQQITWFVLVSMIWLFLTPAISAASENALADVVVVVDTSTSMSEPGMDPERASLLVTKLLADIVPGELAVIRLLGVGTDSKVLPSRDTGKFGKCPENPNQPCRIVERASDWEADARTKKLGALVRPGRADSDYKKRLEQHLEQRIPNSMFDLAFQAALGVFDEHQGQTPVPRTVIWLSDGSSEQEERVKEVVAELKASGAAVEAIVFGAGDTRLPRAVGVDVLQVSTPAEMMKAFANAFRRIVQAPYRIDNRVDAAPTFEMKRNIQEAWIVVYGDDTLGEVDISGPGATVTADYAADRWPGAGAYKVAYLRQPAPGSWTVHAKGGGAGTAYAVIQRSDLMPSLLEPEKALAGVQIALVAGVRAGLNGELIADPELLKDATIRADVQGQKIRLSDDGTQGDAVANDGRYTGLISFRNAGRIPVRLHLQSPVADRFTDATVMVGGKFHYTGGPLTVDLGTLGVGAESCRPLAFQADHQGEVAFELQSLRRPPRGHTLEVKLPAGVLQPSGKALAARPGEPMQVCLKTAARVASSQAAGEPWLLLRVAGSQQPEHQITVNLRWRVEGLSFWQLWGWLILLILAVLLLLFILLGFILPQRFRSTLAVTFVPDREELDEQSPQPVKQWKGVGIGFYRNARAYLHPDYRLSGKAHGALAGLYAERGGNRVMPGNGITLFRETVDGDWETVPAQGGRIRAGDIYRVGDKGPYFRIAVKG